MSNCDICGGSGYLYTLGGDVNACCPMCNPEADEGEDEEMITADQELVSFTLALEEMASDENNGVGVKGLKFMCRQAARNIRKCRPDLAFVEHPTLPVSNGDRQ